MAKQYHSSVGFYSLSRVFAPDWATSNLMEVEITCPNCKQVTTRAACECKPSFYDDIEYRNYYCGDCGQFLRCDAQFTPLPVKQDVTGVTEEDSSDE